MTLATWLPEDAAVRVELVDDDVRRFSNSLTHFVWCGRIAGVEHVRVRDDDLPGRPHDGAHVGAACRRRT